MQAAAQAEASESVARPVVALSGVPRALLGGNINSVSTFDNGRHGTGTPSLDVPPPGVAAPGVVPNLAMDLMEKLRAGHRIISTSMLFAEEYGYVQTWRPLLL